MKICPQTCAACCGRLCAVFILLMSVNKKRTKNHILFSNKIFKSKKKISAMLTKIVTLVLKISPSKTYRIYCKVSNCKASILKQDMRIVFMYTLTVHEISLFPRLPIAFCEIPLNFVWKDCRQSTLRIHSFTFCFMSRDTFHYRGETNQMWSYAPQRYDHTHMPRAYVDVIWCITISHD